MRITEVEEGVVDTAILFHKSLNPNLFNGTTLRDEVRTALLRIAQHFIDYVNIDELKVVDITISGSSANYTYTPNSDLDLHIVVETDPKDYDTMKELYDAKKNTYNYQHDITVKGIDVELYIQDTSEEHHSSGIYSIKNNKWINKPEPVKKKFDDQDVEHKVSNYIGKIKLALDDNSYDSLKKVMDELKKLRQNGLETQGEFGVENVAYKVLRNNQIIELIRERLNTLQDLELSIENANK
jgi:predicted nucleotidyltransferase